MSKQNAFTLVELLAVIAVLGLILIIAVPKITSVMENSKKKTLVLTAKSIARSAEEKKIENDTFDIEEEITCDSISDYSSDDFSSCTITFDEEGKAIVTLIGKGSYKGFNVCNATKMNAEVTKEECNVNKLITHIKNLYNNETTKIDNGLIRDNTIDQNIRYSGSNEVVRNYVEFGNENELWRIIGIFEVETENGPEELVKIIREDSIGHIAWDISNENINSGYGINQWGPSGNYEGADLMRILNNQYLNKQNVDGMCYNYEINEIETCNFSNIGMSSTYKNMIETVTWNTGAIDITDSTIADGTTRIANTVNWYNAERSIVGKICTGGDECNDNIERTSTWEGLVALPYGTDYAYSTSKTECHTNLWYGFNQHVSATECMFDNWMHFHIDPEVIAKDTLLLSPVASTQDSCGVSTVYIGGTVTANYTSSPLRIHPTVYLNANVKIEDGIGTEGSPYKLSL